METKLKSDEMRRLNGQRLKFYGCFNVDCEVTNKYRRGGLSMLWREETKLSLISFSLHHILCQTIRMDDEGDWSISGIYGWPDTAQRDQTWQLLRALRNMVNDSWLCCGDFNEIMWNAEKKGGQLKSSCSMGMFRDALYSCKLRDLGFIGSAFTWSNGRQGKDNIMERLDRATATKEWIDRYPGNTVRHLPRFKSDHSPIVIICEGNRQIPHRKKVAASS